MNPNSSLEYFAAKFQLKCISAFLSHSRHIAHMLTQERWPFQVQKNFKPQICHYYSFIDEVIIQKGLLLYHYAPYNLFTISGATRLVKASFYTVPPLLTRAVGRTRGWGFLCLFPLKKCQTTNNKKQANQPTKNQPKKVSAVHNWIFHREERYQHHIFGRSP